MNKPHLDKSCTLRTTPIVNEENEICKKVLRYHQKKIEGASNQTAKSKRQDEFASTIYVTIFHMS